MATDTVVAVRTSYDKKNAFSAQAKMRLPEKITAGDVADVQLSPYGEFEQVLPDGRRVVQIVDGDAMRNICFNFAARPDGIVVRARVCGGPTQCPSAIGAPASLPRPRPGNDKSPIDPDCRGMIWRIDVGEPFPFFVSS